VIFVRKRGDSEIPSDDEPIFMTAPDEIGYDATGRKTNNQLPEVVKQYEEFHAYPQSFFV
jgi:type I restriction enzyme M protein